MKIPYWIQRADYAGQDFDPVDLAEAQHTFASFDWVTELNLAQDLENKGEDWCPPGIGFTKADGSILHICPQENGHALLFYHFSDTRKLLGFIPISKQVTMSNENISLENVVQVLALFFNNGHEEMLKFVSE